MYDACVPKVAKDKSRGPKGLELEVGARRAPKLLVFSYFLLLKVFDMILVISDSCTVVKPGLKEELIKYRLKICQTLST